MKFHEKLYSLRRNANMTQTDLAEKLHVSRQAVSRWEMGTAMPDVDNLIAISDLFSVTLDDLLKNREEQPEGEQSEPPEGKPRYWDFLPKKWWLLPVIAIGLRLLSFLMELLVLLIPGTLGNGSAAADGSFSIFFTMLFSVPGMILLSTAFFALTALELLWALLKWLKARK